MKILLTGGSASGKSAYAEQLAVALPGPRIYLATMIPSGTEGQARIERHRAARANKGFETIERYRDLAGLTLPENNVVLLECIGNIVANEMFGETPARTDVAELILEGIVALARQTPQLLVVTNEVGSDGQQYDESVRAYIEVIGTINSSLAQEFDSVYEVCCGIPLLVSSAKGETE